MNAIAVQPVSVQTYIVGLHVGPVIYACIVYDYVNTCVLSNEPIVNQFLVRRMWLPCSWKHRQ